jgi:hypothetical protein
MPARLRPGWHRPGARQHRGDETRKLLSRGHGVKVSAPGRKLARKTGGAPDEVPVSPQRGNSWGNFYRETFAWSQIAGT